MAERRTVVDEEPFTHDGSLHTKYRPHTLGDVVGQDAVVESLRAALKAKSRPHVFCFTGPSGTGKTTLSRILATSFDCLEHNIIEVDAASNSGADDMRRLVSNASYVGFGSSANKAYIIDEAHALSKQAWQVLLKPLEEPPEHVFYFLCTTEVAKLPETIATRCLSYSLKPVDRSSMSELLEFVAEAEKLDVSANDIKRVVSAAEGSPRRALTMLAKISGLNDDRLVQDVLDAPDAPSELIDLCRAIIDARNPPGWADLIKVLQGLPDTPAESIRIMVVNYLSACLMKAKSDKEAMRMLNLLHPFSKPYASSDKLGPLLLSFGDLIFRS